MKKLLTLSAVALALSFTPALAGERTDVDHKGGMFEKHDTNGDGVISKDEFLKQAEERFGKMDANGDGNVTAEEGKAAKEAMHSKREEHREKRKEMRQKKQDAAPATAE